jgi:hypothetical protein
MPTYGFLLIFGTENYISTFIPANLILVIVGISFVFTFLLTAFNALILLRSKKIKSFDMETSKERTIPYISTSFYFFALYYLFYNAEFPPVFLIVILGAGISIVFTFLINFKWKISAHTIGIGGIIGAILGISLRLMIDLHLILMIAILVGGVVGYARLKLNAHDPKQVYCGFLLGFLTEFLLMIFY